MFANPILARCDDRAVAPKVHPTSGSVENWFSDEILRRHQLFGLTFDFFANWSLSPPAITPVIWIKKVLSSNHDYAYVIANLDFIMISELGESYLDLIRSFGSNHNLTIQFILFKDNLDWSLDSSELLIIQLNNRKLSDTIFKVEKVVIVDLKAQIRQYSGMPINIGKKGLTFGTSNLECYLSCTNCVYPGDVDLILLNSKKQPIAIVEFKKHTLSSSIPEQKLANYYPKPDARKYNRLSILKDYLSGKYPKIPMLNLYYPTPQNFNEGRLELLKGETGKLSTQVGSNFLLPKKNSAEDYDKVINKILKAVSYHQSITNRL